MSDSKSDSSNESIGDSFEDNNFTNNPIKKLKRAYTPEEDKKVVEYIVTNNLQNKVKGKSIFKKIADEKVVDRTMWSILERFKKVNHPKILNGEFSLSQEDRDKFPESNILPSPKKNTRTPVVPSDVTAVSKALLLYDGLLTPTTVKFWVKLLKNQEIKINEPHPVRLVSIFRRHIKNKIDSIHLDSKSKYLLKKKLTGNFDITSDTQEINDGTSDETGGQISVIQPQRKKDKNFLNMQTSQEEIQIKKINVPLGKPAMKKSIKKAIHAGKKIGSMLFDAALKPGGVENNVSMMALTTITHLYNCAKEL